MRAWSTDRPPLVAGIATTILHQNPRVCIIGAAREGRECAPVAHRVYQMAFGKVYPLYVLKAEKKGRTREEVHTIIRWLTGYSEEALAAVIADDTDMESFFARAPRLNPDRTLITGAICGIRVEEVEEETMREIRYLDKLIDELARGKAMEKILRG